MPSERTSSLSVGRNRHGAKSVAAVSHRAVFCAASWLRAKREGSSSAVAASLLGLSVSFRARIHSSFAASGSVLLGVASSFTRPRSVAVRSVSVARLAIVTSLRSLSVPNNALVPTAQRHAPLGPRACGAAAAQRGR